MPLYEHVYLARQDLSAQQVEELTTQLSGVIGQMGGKEHIKDIEKLLEDTTNLQTVRFGTTTINAQMRDVALASLILLSGQNAQEYNFPYLQQFHGIRADFNLPPYYYGFSDDAGRQTALKKWKDSQAPKKK